MKRILCTVLAVALLLASCAFASGEACTHPTAGFRPTIPEGWLAIDSGNVGDIIASGRVSAELVGSFVAP